MYSSSDTARSGGIRSTFRRAEAWMDQRGKGAWIAAMVLGFILFWPVGLALLAYMIWGKQMFARSCSSNRHRLGRNPDAMHQDWSHRAWHGSPATGNAAFDSYKAEALRRLEEEQQAFEAFLQRLRNSKDKSEFDAFMDDRARATAAQDAADAEAGDSAATAPGARPSDSARPGEY
jgi:Protein of unknown function (DUF2852)